MKVTAVARRPSDRLAHYDPQKGLKRIAIAEAAEKHFARAKDATKLYQAIEAKLTLQAEFVAWWDAQEKSKGAAVKRRSGSATALRAGHNGLPERYVIERWRQRLTDPKRFESALERAKERCVRIVEAQMGAHVGQNTGDTEWYTPSEYIEAARTVLGAIDLDPASNDTANRVVRAAQIFTSEDNGLTQRWDGRVWMNPPYAYPLIEQFCAKLAESVTAGTVPAAVVLVNNATDTAWFHELVRVAAALCCPLGRIRFWHPEKTACAPLQGQAFLYIGTSRDRFCEVFGPFGFVAAVHRASI